MALNLTEGAIRSIMAGETINAPILQVLGVRKLIHPGSTDRYRIMLTDGIHTINFAMLATQHNHKIESGEIQDNAIIRLNHHITSKLTKEKAGERRVLIILDIELLVPGAEIEKIGNPVLFTEDMLNDVTNTESNNAGASNGHQEMPQMNGRPPAFEQRPAKMARTENYGRGVPSTNDIVTRPISSINPYQNKWIIRARVISKTPIRTWNNSRGSGKLFSLDLKDESGEIRCTAFQEECDKYFDTIQLNNIYYISNCTVKTANKKFTQIKNDFELTFTKETQVIPVEDDIASIPGVEYDFQPIQSLANAELGHTFDVIGVCKSFSDIQSLIARSSGNELKKREITIVDTSNASIAVTLWGEKAENFDGTDHPVVAIRQGKITEFQSSKSIGLSMSATMVLNPELPEAHRLRGWYDNGGSEAVVTSITASTGGSGGGGGFTGEWISLLEAKERQLGVQDSDYYNAVASVMSVRRENCYYLACPTPECKKKVMDKGDGTYRCEKCDKEFDTFNPRMLISLNVGDWSDNCWVTMFDNEAQILLGVTGRELYDLKTSNEEGYNAVFDKVKFEQFQMKVRVKGEQYNDETRLKTVVMKLEKVNINDQNKRMLQEIKQAKAAGIKIEPTF